MKQFWHSLLSGVTFIVFQTSKFSISQFLRGAVFYLHFFSVLFFIDIKARCWLTICSYWDSFAEEHLLTVTIIKGIPNSLEILLSLP